MKILIVSVCILVVAAGVWLKLRPARSASGGGISQTFESEGRRPEDSMAMEEDSTFKIPPYADTANGVIFGGHWHGEDNCAGEYDSLGRLLLVYHGLCPIIEKVWDGGKWVRYPGHYQRIKDAMQEYYDKHYRHDTLLTDSFRPYFEHSPHFKIEKEDSAVLTPAEKEYDSLIKGDRSPQIDMHFRNIDEADRRRMDSLVSILNFPLGGDTVYITRGHMKPIAKGLKSTGKIIWMDTVAYRAAQEYIKILNHKKYGAGI